MMKKEREVGVDLATGISMYMSFCEKNRDKLYVTTNL